MSEEMLDGTPDAGDEVPLPNIVKDYLGDVEAARVETIKEFLAFDRKHFVLEGWRDEEGNLHLHYVRQRPAGGPTKSLFLVEFPANARVPISLATGDAGSHTLVFPDHSKHLAIKSRIEADVKTFLKETEENRAEN